jgi:hypothetical protein
MAPGGGVGDEFLPTSAYATRSPQEPPSAPIAPLIPREFRSIETDGLQLWVNRARMGGSSLNQLLVRGCLGGHGIVRWRMAEKIGDDTAIHVALYGGGENVTEHGRKVRVKIGMSQHRGAIIRCYATSAAEALFLLTGQGFAAQDKNFRRAWLPEPLVSRLPDTCTASRAMVCNGDLSV